MEINIFQVYKYSIQMWLCAT